MLRKPPYILYLFFLIVSWTFRSYSQPSGITRVWGVDDGERIKKTNLTHPLATSSSNKVWNGSSISLFGARNEVIAFQLIIQGNSTGATGVNVTLDSLRKSTTPTYTIKNTGGIGDPYNYVGKRIEMFVEHYMNITDRTNASYMWWSSARPLPDADYTGLQPEILVPFEAAAGTRSHGQGGAPFSVTANQNQGVWVDIYIPRDAEAGDYSGTLKVTENAILRYSIPVNLKVYSFSLPDSSHVRNAFLFVENAITSRHGVSLNSTGYWNMVRKYYALLYRHRANGQHTADTSTFKSQLGQIYRGSYFTSANGYEGPGEGIGPNYYAIGGFDQPNRVPGATEVSDSGWSQFAGGNYYAMKGRGEWSSGVSYQVNDIVHDNDYPFWYWCKRAHTSSASTEPQESGSGSTGWKKYWLRLYDRGDKCGFAFDPDTTVMKQNYWRAADWWVNWFTNNNPSAWIMKYGPEEPNIEDSIIDTSAFADVRRKIRWLKTNPSGRILKFRTATRFEAAQWPMNQSLDVIFNGPSQTGYGGVIMDSVRAAQARGQRVGLYGGTRPHWGVEVIDAPAVDMRMKPWAMWKYGFTEYSYWLIGNIGDRNHWDRDRNSYGNVRKYGDGTLVYPGQDNLYPGDSRGLAGPLAGIRLKNWRRGVQDYEYLYLARQMGLDVTALVDSVVPAAFDEIAPTVQPPWSNKGYKYENVRRQVAELIASAISPLPYGTFTVTPSLLSSGPGNVTLQWSSVNATSASINNGVGAVPVNGSLIVFVDTTKTFTITLVNSLGSRDYSAAVTVKLFPAGTFLATPDTLPPGGGNTILSWTSVNALSATINQGIGNVPVNGSLNVAVDRLKTYTLTLTNNDGTRSYDRTVFLRTPPSGTFTVFPDSIPAEGGDVTLMWTSVNAVSATIELGLGQVSLSDTMVLSLEHATDFTLVLTNPFGTQSYPRHVYQRPFVPKFVSLTPDSLVAKDPVNGRIEKPVRRGRGLYPNWSNLLSELVVQGGFQPGANQSDSAGGLRIGISSIERVSGSRWRPVRDPSSGRGWVRLTKWNYLRNIGSGYNAIQSALEDREGKHVGGARGLDSTGMPGSAGRRALVNEQTKLGPRKFNNILYAELVALKINIVASQLGKTPEGFGELILDVSGHPFDQWTISNIALKADSMLTYWHNYTGQQYQTIYQTISMINRAFVSPLDTLSFESSGQLKLRGSVPLTSVGFLKQTSAAPATLRPTTFEVGDDVGEVEEYFADDGTPEIAKLIQNYPNPFNPSTTISFALRYPSLVTLKVFDILGQEVTTLVESEVLDDGVHEVYFTPSGIASGVYFYRLVATSTEADGPSSTLTRKMLLLK